MNIALHNCHTLFLINIVSLQKGVSDYKQIRNNDSYFLSIIIIPLSPVIFEIFANYI